MPKTGTFLIVQDSIHTSCIGIQYAAGWNSPFIYGATPVQTSFEITPLPTPSNAKGRGRLC